MNTPDLNIVTGAFGYTGRYITHRLLSLGKRVATLTGHPHRENPFGQRVRALPLNLDNPRELTQSLQGATTLYNTYWIRFPYRGITFDRAVERTKTLIHSAQEAGIRRIVHISITNASQDSPLPYFRGKGMVERAILDSGLSYAIIRPTVIFGHQDILINNIAWLLRHFPLFAIPGSGEYQLQPVFVEDVAQIAVDAGQGNGNVFLDTVGPETYTFRELVGLIARAVGSRARLLHLRPGLALFLSRLVGYLVNDVVLTQDEVQGLMANLLLSQGPPTGKTSFKEWLAHNADRVGTQYASELSRHYR